MKTVDRTIEITLAILAFLGLCLSWIAGAIFGDPDEMRD